MAHPTAPYTAPTMPKRRFGNVSYTQMSEPVFSTPRAAPARFQDAGRGLGLNVSVSTIGEVVYARSPGQLYEEQRLQRKQKRAVPHSQRLAPTPVPVPTPMPTTQAPTTAPTTTPTTTSMQLDTTGSAPPAAVTNDEVSGLVDEIPSGEAEPPAPAVEAATKEPATNEGTSPSEQISTLETMPDQLHPEETTSKPESPETESESDQSVISAHSQQPQGPTETDDIPTAPTVTTSSSPSESTPQSPPPPTIDTPATSVPADTSSSEGSPKSPHSISFANDVADYKPDRRKLGSPASIPDGPTRAAKEARGKMLKQQNAARMARQSSSPRSERKGTRQNTGRGKSKQGTRDPALDTVELITPSTSADVKDATGKGGDDANDVVVASDKGDVEIPQEPLKPDPPTDDSEVGPNELDSGVTNESVAVTPSDYVEEPHTDPSIVNDSAGPEIPEGPEVPEVPEEQSSDSIISTQIEQQTHEVTAIVPEQAEAADEIASVESSDVVLEAVQPPVSEDNAGHAVPDAHTEEEPQPAASEANPALEDTDSREDTEEEAKLEPETPEKETPVANVAAEEAETEETAVKEAASSKEEESDLLNNQVVEGEAGADDPEIANDITQTPTTTPPPPPPPPPSTDMKEPSPSPESPSSSPPPPPPPQSPPSPPKSTPPSPTSSKAHPRRAFVRPHRSQNTTRKGVKADEESKGREERGRAKIERAEKKVLKAERRVAEGGEEEGKERARLVRRRGLGG